MPLQRHRYPTDWEAISLRIRERDGWRCKWCGIPNGTVVQGTKRLYKIVLTVAHLGTPREDGQAGDKHDKRDVRDENLAALCQRCHLGYDRKEHIERAKLNRQRLQWLRIQLFLRLRIEYNMTPEEYMQEMLRTAPQGLSTAQKLNVGAMGLAGEAGEVVDLVKKVLFHNHEFDRARLVKELGDQFWYFNLLMDAAGITLTEVMETNSSKLRARYPEGFDPERSINRKAGDD